MISREYTWHHVHGIPTTYSIALTKKEETVILNEPAVVPSEPETSNGSYWYYGVIQKS